MVTAAHTSKKKQEQDVLRSAWLKAKRGQKLTKEEAEARRARGRQEMKRAMCLYFPSVDVKQQWAERAREHGMKISAYILEMAEAGHAGQGVDAEEVERLRSELDKSREEARVLERRYADAVQRLDDLHQKHEETETQTRRLLDAFERHFLVPEEGGGAQ